MAQTSAGARPQIAKLLAQCLSSGADVVDADEALHS
jgi:hypothetical protein